MRHLSQTGILIGLLAVLLAVIATLAVVLPRAPEPTHGTLAGTAEDLDTRVRHLEDRLTAAEAAGDNRERRLDELHKKASDAGDRAQKFIDTAEKRFVLRPVCSKDAMTADVYPIDFALLADFAREIRAVPGAGCLFYDITTKPPGTIEWE